MLRSPKTSAEMVRNARVIRAAMSSDKPRKVIMQSGIMPIARTDMPQGNVQTGRLLRSGKVRKRLMGHTRNQEEMEAAVFAWNHPERLKFKKHSELGEGKDMSNPADVVNIENKKKRHVDSYNAYELTYKRKKWIVGLEVHEDGFEQFYYIKRK